MSTKTITEEEYTEAFDVNRNRWLYEPTMYKNRLYHALSHEPLNGCVVEHLMENMKYYQVIH